MADFIESLVQTFKDNWILGLGVNAILCLVLGALTLIFGKLIKFIVENFSYLIVVGIFFVLFGIVGALIGEIVIKEGEHWLVSLLKRIVFFIIGGFIGYAIVFAFLSFPDGDLIPSILWFAFLEWLIVSFYVMIESSDIKYERQ